MAPGAKPKFADNEKVLCYHGPLLYEAKCVRSKREGKAGGGDFSYFVHYQGWNKNWDEWVPEKRILQINAENLEKKARLLQAHVAATKEQRKKSKSNKVEQSPGGAGGGSGGGSGGGGDKSGVGDKSTEKSGRSRTESASTSRASTPVSDRSTKTGGSNKRQLGDDERSTSSREEEQLRRPAASKRLRTGGAAAGATGGTLSGIATGTASGAATGATAAPTTPTVAGESEGAFGITLPEELKYVLVSDWDLVTHKKSVFNLPAKIPAASILTDYARHVERNNKAKAAATQSVMAGVGDMFNAKLKSQLLYKVERPQYAEVMSDKDQLPSDVYGSAHLLRLMVKLTAFLNETSIREPSDVQLIEGVIADFLTYLESNRAKFFTSKNYSEASEEYLKVLSK